jgi:hypothetical protein
VNQRPRARYSRHDTMAILRRSLDHLWQAPGSWRIRSLCALSGAELGRKLGISERQGRRILADMTSAAV